MLDYNKVKKDDRGYYYLGEYHSYWKNGLRNPEFDDLSNSILNYKKMYTNEIVSFSKKLDQIITNNDSLAILCVPSHEVGSKGPNYEVIRMVCHKRGFIDASNCLVRKQNIIKLAQGGNRSVETHLNSIDLVNAQLLDNKDILLIDDVTTTGNSLRACEIIIKRNVKTVKSLNSFVFAKTVWGK